MRAEKWTAKGLRNACGDPHPDDRFLRIDRRTVVWYRGTAVFQLDMLKDRDSFVEDAEEAPQGLKLDEGLLDTYTRADREELVALCRKYGTVAGSVDNPWLDYGCDVFVEA